VKQRVPAFVAVGAIGLLLQLGALAFLTLTLNWAYGPATAAAVQLAVLHNFVWHERWTWRDRRAQHGSKRTPGDRDGGIAERFARFEVTTGATSIGGNLLGTALLVETLGFTPLAANLAAVVLMSAVNFLVSDRWVFARRVVVVGALGTASALPASASELTSETLTAWSRYVARAESRHDNPQWPIDARLDQPDGDTTGVPGGRIHRWRSATLIRGTTVDAVVRALTYPGTPPPQDDILEARVLNRSDESLHVYLKLVRRTLMTVTYDTEHRMTFHRYGPGLATSRSVATRIAEVDGRDRGFLWRLNSYWRYVQVGDDVRVELESISLSRDVPAILKPVAGPIINRIGRESLMNTLNALRSHCARN
jgi:putative flippase GtrA